MSRLSFASRFALRHLLLSASVGLLSAAYVFGLLYPPPFQAMLGVGPMFLLLLAVDVVCGPLLTLVLASPQKSRRAQWVDWSLVGVLQVLALSYGLHTVWVARPVVLAFEVDRLVVATANEVQVQDLPLAPKGMQQLPWWGVLPINTRAARDSTEQMQSIELGLAGASPAMRPGWWLPWETGRAALAQRARPLADLLRHRPQDALRLQAAVGSVHLPIEALFYLPVTSSQSREWVVLMDGEQRLLNFLQVDGF